MESDNYLSKLWWEGSMYLGICNVLRTYSKTINNLVEILGFETHNPGTHWETLC